jgi:hypothetical protein
MANVAMFTFNTWEARAIYEDGQLVWDYDAHLETAIGIYKFQGADIKYYRCKPGLDDEVYLTWLDMESNSWPKMIDIIPLDKFVELELWTE